MATPAGAVMLSTGRGCNATRCDAAVVRMRLPGPELLAVSAAVVPTVEVGTVRGTGCEAVARVPPGWARLSDPFAGFGGGVR